MTDKNVQGWERAASIAGGLYFLGKGLGRGGLGGLLSLAVGGMALARGMTGHCEAKRVLSEMNEHSTMNPSKPATPWQRSESRDIEKPAQTSSSSVTGSPAASGSTSPYNPPPIG